jgi:hypothetical protein
LGGINPHEWTPLSKAFQEEAWKETETAVHPNLNWVHTFAAEGHWVLKGSIRCFPGDTTDESTIDKSGQVIVGDEKTTTG